ncbi:MAG: cation:proton antiporter [Ruminococcus sp.]
MSAFKEFLFNNDYSYLLQIAIILLSTKLLGLLTKRISLPQVVGALAAGIILGPMLLDVVERNDLIVSLAELGVIVLMFSAGLETDIQELKKAGLASFVIALVGVIVPLLGGYFLADLYNTDQDPEMASLFWQNIFIGVVLTATSVSITVETLKELGALNSRAGNAILGAAVIGDILGIIALTVVISLGGKKSGGGESARTLGSALVGDGIFAVVINILAFFIVAIGAAVLYHFFFKNGGNPATRTSSATTSSPLFSACCSPLPQSCSSVSQISPALSLPALPSGLKKNEYVVNRFNTLSYMLLSPIFFANIGLAMTLDGLTGKLIIFMLLLMLVAVATKVIGCGLGAKIMRYTNKESLQIGIGMISRGEVALIVANKGASVGLMSEKFMTPLVIMVVFTTIITPILLKFVFPKNRKHDERNYRQRGTGNLRRKRTAGRVLTGGTCI